MISKQCGKGATNAGEAGKHQNKLVLVFPKLEIVAAVFEAYRSDPRGFRLSGRIWAELGIQTSIVNKEALLRACVSDGLLCAPTQLWGILTGYVPGAAAFRASNVNVRVEGLPQTPTLGEIQAHQRSRVLAKIAEALRGTDPATRISSVFRRTCASGASVIDALIAEGLVVRQHDELKPTDAFQQMLPPQEFPAQLTVPKSPPGERRSLYKEHAAKRKAFLEQITPELVSIISGKPGLNPTQLFREVQQLPAWPTESTKGMFLWFLKRLVRDKVILARCTKSGNVKHTWVYHPPSL
jgi:hypothetical protein